MADITPLLQQLLARAQARTAALTTPSSAPSDQLLQVARLAEERKNRQFLQSEAKERLAAADAARVMAVQLKQQDFDRQKASYRVGYEIGVSGKAPATLPEDIDPQGMKEGMASGRLLRGAETKESRQAEKKELAEGLQGILATVGGDPRRITKDPALYGRFPVETQMQMARYSNLLDEEDKAVAEAEKETGEVLAVQNAPDRATLEALKPTGKAAVALHGKRLDRFAAEEKDRRDFDERVKGRTAEYARLSLSQKRAELEGVERIVSERMRLATNSYGEVDQAKLFGDTQYKVANEKRMALIQAINEDRTAGPTVTTPEGTTKPGIQNADGSVSSERSITIEVDGTYYNIPTIREGKQLSEDDAIRAAEAEITGGSLKGYKTLEEAEREARARSGSMKVNR